jgi:hypothetical protein
MQYLTFSTKKDAQEQKERFINEGFTKANIVRMKNGLYAVIADPSGEMLKQPDYFSFAEEFGKEIGREVDVPQKIAVQPPVIEVQSQVPTPPPVVEEKKWYPPNFAGIGNDFNNNSDNNIKGDNQ